MKHLLFLTTLLCVTTLTGCNSKGEIQWPWDELKPAYNELHTMVYIDLSRSRDSTSILSALDKMEAIYLAQQTNIDSRFIVKVIDSDNSVAALFDSNIAAQNSSNIEIKRKFNTEREEEAKKMRENILKYYREVAPYTESSMQSCICNSLENSNAYFQQLDTGTCKIQMIVFSDMYEECKKKSSYLNEDFCMCNGEHTKRKSLKELTEILRKYTPKNSLKKYVKAKDLYFIMDEDNYYNESQNLCLKFQEVRTIWEDIFIKMGYSKHELKTITFSEFVPSRLTQTEE